jgi:histidinol-phosphate aminotransferase
MEANVVRVESERSRLAAALSDAGWVVGPSVTNFLLADFGTPERAAATADGLLRRGLVPRTFGQGHLLASHLRLTIRDRAGNDRLIAAARAASSEEPR